MASAVVKSVVACEGCAWGDVYTAYYVSGRHKDYIGEMPVQLQEWCDSHKLVVDTPKGKNGRYRRWE